MAQWEPDELTAYYTQRFIEGDDPRWLGYWHQAGTGLQVVCRLLALGHEAHAARIIAYLDTWID